MEINPEKPRSKSFNLTLIKEDGTVVQIWDGLKKGPPRNEKWPEGLHDDCVTRIKSELGLA